MSTGCIAALNGLAAALALAGRQALRPLSVAIIDAKNPSRFATSAFDGRASAITAASRRMLEALGVWEAIAPNAQPINRIIVTDAAPGSELQPALLQFGAGQPRHFDELRVAAAGAEDEQISQVIDESRHQ